MGRTVSLRLEGCNEIRRWVDRSGYYCPQVPSDRSLLALLAAALCFCATPAEAHPLDVGAVQLSVRGGDLTATLDLSAVMARRLLEIGEGLPVPESGESALAAATLLSGQPTLGETPCQLASTGTVAQGDRFLISVAGRCEGSGELRWSLPFIEKLPFSFRVLGRAQTAVADEEFILSSGHTELVLRNAAGSRRTPEHFWQFIFMGMQHIGSTPDQWWGPRGLHLPDGIDHILFLVALLLTGIELVPVLKTVTGFTLGHSVTLSLATLGLVQLPSRWVEAAIALSIAYVAAEDFWIKGPGNSRWKIAAAFGLVHGFGFAKALSELHLPRARLVGALFGFNLGVEIGQEIIVVALLPLLWLLFKSKGFERVGRKVCAGGILACALVWFGQRAFGP
jgi:HupE / UreJ protein